MSYPPLYTDETVDGAVVRGLQRLGWDVVRAVDLHAPGAPDELHFKSAAEMKRILVSNDHHMLAIAARWSRTGRRFAGLVFWVPDKFSRVGDILRALAKAAASEAENQALTGYVKYL